MPEEVLNTEVEVVEITEEATQAEPEVATEPTEVVSE